MQVFDTIKKTEYYTSVALGFFDGVHKGHQDVIRNAIAAGSDICPATVFTFRQSPSRVISGAKKPLLTTNEQKFELFEALGVKVVFCIDFSEIKDMPAEEFVHDVLYKTINAKYISTGFNYHFGKGGTSDADDMVAMCNELNISAIKHPPVIYKNKPVSSTRIRECIANGDIEGANAMLGYDFAVDNKIISGNHIGTSLRSPTINQSLTNDIITPKFGVYASKVTIDDKTYMGATNIGTHPTVGGDTPVCETHLLDFTGGDLYQKRAYTQLVKFIRPEQKFNSITQLKAQIEKDKDCIKNFLLR